MKKSLLILLCLTFTFSCKSQQGEKSEPMEISVYFYPSSGGEEAEAIYTIDVVGDSLIVKNHEPLYPEKVNFYKGNLTESQRDTLKKLIEGVKKRKHFDNEIVLDSWRMELFINGDKVYENSDMRIKTLPNDIKALVKYLVELSPVEIDLYGFS